MTETGHAVDRADVEPLTERSTGDGGSPELGQDRGSKVSIVGGWPRASSDARAATSPVTRSSETSSASGQAPSAGLVRLRRPHSVRPAPDVTTVRPGADLVTAGPAADLVTVRPGADLVAVRPPADLATVEPGADVVTVGWTADEEIAVEEIDGPGRPGGPGPVRRRPQTGLQLLDEGRQGHRGRLGLVAVRAPGQLGQPGHPMVTVDHAGLAGEPVPQGGRDLGPPAVVDGSGPRRVITASRSSPLAARARSRRRVRPASDTPSRR